MANRKITFAVTIEFLDSIYDDQEVMEVQENVLKALIRQVDADGLAPENSETFTKALSVEDCSNGSYAMNHSFMEQ